MIDRRAMIIGSWLAKGRDKPTPQKVKSITNRWRSIFTKGPYGFRSLTNKRKKPEPIHNPDYTKLIAALDQAKNITDDTELLLYFLGHSTSVGEDDIQLTLSIADNGEDKVCNLKWLLDTIYQQTSIRRLVIILDTCHAGRTRQTFLSTRLDFIAMLATGTAYAFDANFSEGLLRAFEDPLRKSDQRIDRRAGGVTYQKVFEVARNYVINKTEHTDKEQYPSFFDNGYSSELILKAPLNIPIGYNSFASDRTIYGRIFKILDILVKQKKLTRNELYSKIGENKAFLLRRDEKYGSQYLSSERFDNYLDFLREIRWLVQPEGLCQATAKGQQACNEDTFNRDLLAAIERFIFYEELDMESLDKIVSELLTDMIPPTPIKIKERAGMKGIPINLTPAVRVALQVLPSTGRFLKGSADAIFPSELG